MMPRDVKTRWNFTYLMLNFSLDYQEAIDEITANRNMKIRKFEMSKEEWVLARKLAGVLKVWFQLSCHLHTLTPGGTLQIFYDATTFFSRSTPNIAAVIPAMDRIDKQLGADISALNARCPALADALRLGKKLLSNYRKLIDCSEVYRIAMGTFLSLSTFVLPNYILSSSSPPRI